MRGRALAVPCLTAGLGRVRWRAGVGPSNCHCHGRAQAGAQAGP